MVIFADEIWGLLFWLSRGGAKESKLKEIKGNGEGTKTKTLCKNSREEKMEHSTTTTILPSRDLTSTVSS